MTAARSIVHVMPPEPFGGLQTLVVDLAKAQKVAGESVKIILLAHSERVIARCEDAGIEVVALSGGKVGKSARLKAELRANRGAIIHSHCEPIWASPILASYGKRWVSHLHVYPKSGPRDLAINLARRLWARRSIAISHSVADEWADRRLVTPRRLGVVHNGIDPGKFASPPKDRHSPFTVTFLGRAEREKGLFDFIEIADQLRDMADLRFLLAGEGSDLDEARRRILDRDLTQNVSVLGFVTKPEEVWQASDLLLMLSSREPFGLVVLEALANGVAVLGYDTSSGGSEVMATLPGCTMVDVFDIPALVARVREAAQDPELRKRALFGREIMTARGYTIDRMAAGVMAQYAGADLA